MSVLPDESGSDSDGGSSSSSFSSLSELSAKDLVKENDQTYQELNYSQTMCSGLDPASVYNPPKVLQVTYAAKYNSVLLSIIIFII